MTTFIIGECASTHDGSLEKALRLVDAAAMAGCSAAKFQYWSSAARMADRRRAPDYLDIYRRYAVPATWLPRLRARAESRGVEFMCTTFLPEDVAPIAPFVKRFKISSFEAEDVELLDVHGRFRKPVIISKGGTSRPMARLHIPGVGVYYLHCVSAYPAPPEELNLGAIRGLRSPVFDFAFDGLSDHSGLIETGGIAVAAGARILEVHLRLDDTDPANPDAGEFALTPYSLRAYVAFVRQVELMMGTGEKRLMPSEVAMSKYRVRA